MLHELILALNGCHGQIFYVNEDDSKFQFKVSESVICVVKLWSKSMIFRSTQPCLCFILLSLASCKGSCPWPRTLSESSISLHRTSLPRAKVSKRTFAVSEFISNFVLSNQTKGSEDALSGLYVEAICEGLGLVLRPYQQLLMHLEKHVLVEGNTQLTFIQHKIQPFEPVFAAVNNLIRQVREQNHSQRLLKLIPSFITYCSSRSAKLMDASFWTLFTKPVAPESRRCKRQ